MVMRNDSGSCPVPDLGSRASEQLAPPCDGATRYTGAVITSVLLHAGIACAIALWMARRQVDVPQATDTPIEMAFEQAESRPELPGPPPVEPRPAPTLPPAPPLPQAEAIATPLPEVPHPPISPPIHSPEPPVAQMSPPAPAVPAPAVPEAPPAIAEVALPPPVPKPPLTAAPTAPPVPLAERPVESAAPRKLVRPAAHPPEPQRQKVKAEEPSENHALTSTAAATAPPPSSPAPVSATWQQELSVWLSVHKVYPEEARRRGESGSVRVRFAVDRSGHVGEVTVIRGSGSPVLDRGAETMLRNAKLPAFPATMPQDTVQIVVDVRFALSAEQ